MGKKFGQDDNNGLKFVCRMWEMEKRLDLFILQPALLISTLSFMNFNSCDKLDGVSWADKRKWPPQLMKDMSGKFVDFFNMAFSIGTAKWSQSMKEWFSEKRMPGEGALMHWMRMNGVNGKVRELGEAKLRMIRHLMLEEDLALLESKWPLIMAFGEFISGNLFNETRKGGADKYMRVREG
ncbi:hypothetical protein niasHT_016263 [Heterodera trifolii]|uniref:Uncharacterized protein n=1 Tax=Heterodera trifolii TaxID=157864 RepID=A0ABD2LIW9_9BILA